MKYGKVGFSDNVVTAKDIIIATGSVPFVPKGIEIDGKSFLPISFCSCFMAVYKTLWLRQITTVAEEHLQK